MDENQQNQISNEKIEFKTCYEELKYKNCSESISVFDQLNEICYTHYSKSGLLRNQIIMRKDYMRCKSFMSFVPFFN